MIEELVTLETAKMLKEKGFNKFCSFAYIDEYCNLMSVHTTNSLMDKMGLGYSAPNQSFAQKWLRETKNLHICIIKDASGYSYDICKEDNGTHIAEGVFKGPNDGGQWDTYEEALEAGIFEALKLI